MTRFEKRLIESGTSIITWEHDEIADYLIDILNRDIDELTLEAAADETNRRTLEIILSFSTCFGAGRTNFGGSAIYDKTKRKFTRITYSDKHNWRVEFSIASKVYFSYYEHHQQWKHIFPYGATRYKLRDYLLNN
jgi:hypothetical protein